MLLRELRETARGLGLVADGEREARRSHRLELRSAIADLPWDDALEDALREHLSHVSARLERLESGTSGAGKGSREALELRGDLSWLPMLLPEAPLEETLVALEAELGAVAPAAEELAERDGGAAGEELARKRDEVLRVRRARLGHRASQLVEDDSAPLEEIWETYLETRDLDAREEEASGQTAKFLRELLVARVAELPFPAAAELAGRFAAEYEDRSLDSLARQVELPPRLAARALDRSRREMSWLRVLIEKTIDRADEEDASHAAGLKSLKLWSRRLSRAGNRLRNEAQEARLQGRQEDIFGRRAVVLFENMILWLILGVLVVLLVEAMTPHVPAEIPVDAHRAASWSDPGHAAETWVRELERGRRWRPFLRILVLADAAICAVFLIEFIGKMILVRGRWRWFLRHFMVDLVPSIPYGLITFHTFDLLRFGRLGRVLRIARIMRYLRVARPVVRFIRVFGFLQRASDRMIRQHGSLLNRNVVLFEPAPLETTEAAADLRVQLRRARTLARKTWRRLAGALEPDVRSRRLRSFLARLPGTDRLLALPITRGTEIRGGPGLLRAEELVSRLNEVDPGTVDAEIGLPAATHLSNTLDRIDVPLIRRFPFLGPMISAAREEIEPLPRVAAAARALGRYVETLLERIHWFSDLSGVITGPQFLDRIGTGMVQATARPARRLLIFGFGFLLLKAFVHLLGLGALKGLADALERILGLPFLILGTACLAILLLGGWFRRIAGEATDFYQRTAEAQYINLLKSAKLLNLAEDMEVLWQRVLRPEALLREEDEAEGGGAADLRRKFESRAEAAGSPRASRVLQLYDDYLDGAVFHHSDTKTTSQLLGNLALENIRAERLVTTRRDRKRLAALDLDRERSVIRGPYFWFRSINHSVAQWTAKLILDYNRNVIPLVERDAWPAEAVRICDRWLGHRIRQASTDDVGRGEHADFVTTAFTALHFLTADEERDRSIRDRFGERALEALQVDRRGMIRTIFGTYPFHRQPRANRTVNPFDLYARHLGGGRILLLPLYSLYAVLRAVGWFVRRIRSTLREILESAPSEADPRANWASLDVATRKINRMRKPLFMECARFHAMFDPEYLGLSLRTEVESGLEGRTYREDLERIDARAEEWDVFEALRSERAEALVELGAEVEEAGGPEAWIRELRADDGSRPWSEAWRAVAVAWAIDYRRVRTLRQLRDRMREAFAEAIRTRGRVPGRSLTRRFLRLFLPTRRLRRELAAFLRRFGGEDWSPRERKWLWRAVRGDLSGLVDLVRLGSSLEPGTEPEEAAREVLRAVAQHPESWSEQILTLRTVQALTVLDVRNYRRQVRELGGYE